MEALLDLYQIETLRDDLGQDGLGEVFGLFEAEAHESLKCLATKIDATERSRLLHSLCGSARTLGMTSLANACDRSTDLSNLRDLLGKSLIAFTNATGIKSRTVRVSRHS